MDVLRRASVGLILFVLAVISAGACNFAPDFADGSFACAADQTCPSGYACAADGRCYRPGAGPATTAGGDGGPPAGPPGPKPVILVAEVSGLEGNDASAPDLVFTARLVPASTEAVRVDYATVDDSAKAGSDYIAATGTIVFPPGSTSQTVKVKLAGDRIVEPNEVFFLALTNPVNATIDAALEGGRVKATILNDDSPGIIVDDIVVTEGDTGTTNASFTVTLTGPFTSVVTVDYATQNGTATAPEDFTASSDTLTFQPGELTKTVSVPIAGDLIHEQEKQFSLTLSNAVGAPLLDGQATCTIKDNDPIPTVTIANASIAEGDTGTVNMAFEVTLSAASDSPVKVSFATASGTASASDYSAASGTVEFAPGQTSKSISVAVSGDTLDEADETFTVTLSAPVGATLGAKSVGTGTILDDDDPPVVSIEGVALAEGNAGTKTFPFTVRLSAASSKPITVAYSTANGTATAGSDYVAATGNVSFAAGETEKTINVTVNGDTADEGVETFTVTLASPTNATLGTATATGTILNDDSQDPSITINDVAITEGNSGTQTLTFTLTLTCPVACPGGVSQSVTVDYETADLTAMAGTDYVGIASGQVTFPPFTVTRTIDVTINGDTLYEPNETFAVNLTGATGGNILDAQGIGTITNDENKPSISIAPVTDTEGNVGTKSFSFEVTLSGPASTNVTVNYATAAGTATAGADYQTTSGTLTFAPGELTKTVDVSITGDLVWELDETFTVNLTNPSANATIATASATGTIQNDEALPSISIDNVTRVEGDSGTTSFVFTVTLSGASSQTINVDYATQNGSATAGSDYSTAMGQLSFPPGTTTRTITVVVSGDTDNEPNETFNVNLTLPGGTNATIADGTGVGTITNDDSSLVSISINSPASRTEGQNVTFTVTLSEKPGAQITVDWAVVHLTTVAADFTSALSGTLTFSPGQQSQTIVLNTFDDVLNELTETFEVHLSNPSGNATILNGVGTGTLNDDNDPRPSLSIDNVSQNEGNSGLSNITFTVTLSAVSGRTVTVDYATQDVSATSLGGSRDYNATSGTLTFLPGETMKTITTSLKGDTTPESDETFHVVLSNAAGAGFTKSTGIGTIQNDD